MGHPLLTPLRLLRPRLPMLLPMLLLPLLLTERSVKLTPQSLEEPQLSCLPQPLLSTTHQFSTMLPMLVLAMLDLDMLVLDMLDLDMLVLAMLVLDMPDLDMPVLDMLVLDMLVSLTTVKLKRCLNLGNFLFK